MSNVLTEVKSLLDGLGSLGTIVMGKLPASPDAVGVLYEYGGQAPEKRFGIVGIGYEKPSIQVAFRGAPSDYTGPRAKAEIAYRFLAGILPGRLSVSIATEYLKSDVQESPHPVAAPDQNDRHLIGFNIYFMKEPS